MKINKNKFIYLISPLKIKKSFYRDLIKVFKTNKVSFFQLRLKRKSFKQKLIIGKKIKKICKNFNVKFLINDDVFLTKKIRFIKKIINFDKNLRVKPKLLSSENSLIPTRTSGFSFL